MKKIIFIILLCFNIKAKSQTSSIIGLFNDIRQSQDSLYFLDLDSIKIRPKYADLIEYDFKDKSEDIRNMLHHLRQVSCDIYRIRNNFKRWVISYDAFDEIIQRHRDWSILNEREKKYVDQLQVVSDSFFNVYYKKTIKGDTNILNFKNSLLEENQFNRNIDSKCIKQRPVLFILDYVVEWENYYLIFYRLHNQNLEDNMFYELVLKE